ncbi:lamin tail domain-containing protein [Leifsonia sp. H3M29-4]|uniref:lamin tail domain-containing protein n=1 Tax=Salinibacterium metalliresistens TaxID=3031321 RepID=UPI0023DA9EC0|nr:lamin tail domain-containing protein [Salinibacterium metalliresistens]MDF1479296.1 lamin tail domain-containing protein [Salinibacterium metalliresistens]
MLRLPIAVLTAAVFVIGGAAAPAAAASSPTVVINEIANGGIASDSDSFFELRNAGDAAVDLTGWHVFRCSWQGLRANVGRPETDLTGVVLAPGEIFTVSKTGMPGDAHFTQPFALTGFGLYLEGPDAALVDAVGVYPNEPWPTQSECTVGENLTNSLDFATNQSWQRTASGQWVAAPATIGAQNVAAAPATADTSVVISEIASAGPGSSGDEFVELVNTGDEIESIGGWSLYRCTATGRSRANTLELTVQAGVQLAPGERWVIGGAQFEGAAGARLHSSLADLEFGVLMRDGEGALVDRVAVSAYGDSACQQPKLPAVLDAVAGESYQRAGDGWVVAPRTPGERNASRTESIGDAVVTPGPIAISELATDPSTEGMPAGTEQRNYIELGNYGDEPVDVSGYTVRRCEADGMRSRELQFTVPQGTRLAAGEVLLAARAGTAAASVADLTYPESLNFLGTGVWVEDAAGTLIDRVGVYAANEMDASNVAASPCTSGHALTTYQPDRLLSETFQRAGFAGDNAEDFAVGEATPGELDLLARADPTARVVTPATAALPAPTRAFGTAHVMPTTAATVLESWSGVTDGAPLTTLVGPAETPGALPIADDGWGYPYHRFVLDASAMVAGDQVGWTGTTVARGEVQLSVWNGAAWRLLDSGSGELLGVLEAQDLIDGTVTLLVQDGPRTTPTVTTERDGALENPTDYDFALTHITDTQYLSESYPEVYAQLASWIADNAQERKIAFAAHTGDLIQNWVDPDQSQARARVEFERASAIQSILDDAAVPNSVLPGNHDNKRGVTNELFNEYFGPERYAGTAWYGQSIAPDDNSASFSTFEHEGARFLVLSLGYAYGEAEIAWASEVVASHPDHNVIIATHEHVMPKTLEESAHRSVNSRWISRGQELWDRVIAPNRNVAIVLSGHFHGIGQLVTENAGGIEGHTVVELLADYQEFRTHTGERATGFYRMLQFDVDAGAIAVDTRSVRLAAAYSADYDYRQFLPDNGLATTPSNARPWRIVDSGVQGRYSEEDDEFTAAVTLQHPKAVTTESIAIGGR